MWIEHDFIFTAEIYNVPVVKSNTFNSNEISLTLKADKCDIPTVLSGRGTNSFFNGKFKCPDNKMSWTDDTCLPKWIKKGARVLIKGRIDGRINDKKGDKVPQSYFLNFTEVIPLNVTPDVTISKASARGEVFFAKHVNEDKETMLLMKEALKKMNPGDLPKFRYYRVLYNKKLDLDAVKPGTRPIFYGKLGRDCLPVPATVTAALAADPNNKSAKYDVCFAPVIIADEFYL